MAKQVEALDAGQVCQYLEANPEFFTRQDAQQVLERIRIPHKMAGSISLLEYQIKKMRSSNARLVDQLGYLIMVHEENERICTAFLQILHALYSVASLRQLLKGMPRWWANAFDNIGEVRLLLPYGKNARAMEALESSIVLYPATNPPREIENAYRSKQHEYGCDMSAELRGLFATITPGSFLLLGATNKSRGGLLLGSENPERFSQHLNADFALAVARACIARVWDLFAVEHSRVDLQQGKVSANKPVNTNTTSRSKKGATGLRSS